MILLYFGLNDKAYTSSRISCGQFSTRAKLIVDTLT